MKKLLLAATMLLLPVVAFAQDLPPLNPDTDASRINWFDLQKLGPVPDAKGQHYGVVLKTLTNPYWRQLAEGYRAGAKQDGSRVTVQAAQGESDQIGQLSIMENMIDGGYKGLLISPQTDANLQPAIDEATKAGVAVVDVDDAVVSSIGHFVGNVQRDNGVRAAKWMIAHHPEGGKVAVVEGQAGVFAAIQRTAGFSDTIKSAKGFTLVASVPGNWDRQQSYDAATTILQQHPDLIGIYCNNDTMALGVVEAVKAANLLGKVRVIGTDGTSDAYTSIKAGELTGTVDSFPKLTGVIALEVIERLVAGQTVPRVVATPQALVTQENMARYTGDLASQEAALKQDATSQQ
ncbi:sugar ABC transporter substrate-binding protein [Acidisoma cladoniae]|jgi:ribose transport system substrate-binding protein|uniref:sugar ABC transporter substrate-binding protein n=1 Tax=Acidisoma cladoniae TaxID=3040935 RepID=UPI002550959F|nr:substrate-binding domain-containing protein [Acidisoma sp. PAMC 29798]